MKHFKLLLISGIIGVFFLGCSEEKVAKAEPVPVQAEPSGKIIKIKGEVFSTKNGKKTQLSLNSKIFPGSTLETGKDSLARVLFSDGGVIAIGKESSFALEDYFYSENEKRADINFKRGMFEAISGKIGKSNPDKFKLKAKTATMGIRGTHIVGNLKDDGEDLLACIEGAIVVEAKDISGNITTAPVKAGMQVKVDETNTEGIKPSSIEYDEILAIINSTGLKGGEKILEKALRNLNPKPKVKRKGSYFHLALGVNRKARENVRYKLISKITGVKINSRTGELKVPTQLVEDNPITVAVKVTAKDYDETKEYVIQKGDAKDWVDIKAGAGFIVALKNDGTLWAWGKNNDGQLGLGYKKFVIKPTNVFSKIPFKSFDVGENFVVAVKADGTLWTWGDNTNGKLGLDDYSTRRKPTQIGKEKNWNSVSVGESHSLALKADGSLWAWGENIGGKLGTGDSIDYTKPTKIQSDTPWEKVTAGMEHSLGIKKDGTLWAWGVN
ncbi:MAG: FecR domain-containing protein, partial [Campylobacterales bacterium]|nr:FecR domain-containing protein [Campylobacterales bacterium]